MRLFTPTLVGESPKKICRWRLMERCTCALSTPPDVKKRHRCCCRLKQYETALFFQVKLPTCANQGVFELPEWTQTCVVDCCFAKMTVIFFNFCISNRTRESVVGNIFCSGSFIEREFLLASVVVAGSLLTVKAGKNLLALWAMSNWPWWVVFLVSGFFARM